MPLLIDVHCHLDHELFKKDIDDVIRRAKDAGVKKIITNGVNSETNRISLALAKKYDIVEAALGWYPQDALAKEVESGEYPLQKQLFTLDEELDFIKKQKFVALGEVGLDYQHATDIPQQKKDFEKIIAFAEKVKKPLIVHSRKAETDVVEMLESLKAKKVVMHCFSGNFKLVKKIMDNGWSFSIPTNVVKSHHFQKIIAEVNISHLLTETDGPYLSPFPGRRNEPAFVLEAVRKIAEIKKLDMTEVENNLFMNYQNMFM
ncbi:MAG: TatD family hydrolase [Nanoarchaeota archaeon]|nr:TatD family hydrolase [Nanoarchaeota archaeon]